MLAKRSGGSLAFVWLFSAVGVVALAVPAAVALAVERPRLGGAQLLFIAGSGLLHIVYFLLLQSGYRAGDLSLVYPTARGSGVLLATPFTAAVVTLLDVLVRGRDPSEHEPPPVLFPSQYAESG
jgi:hypothetical protein